MTKYKVYFEIYGKKMSTYVWAKNEKEAQEQIKNKIVFHKVAAQPMSKEESNQWKSAFEMFDRFFNNGK